MSSEAKFVGVVIVLAVVAVASFVIFGRNTETSNPAAHVDPADLEDAGQLVRSDSYTVGNPEASVTVVDFGDYQCPACKNAEPELIALKAEYSDRVLFVHRHFPLPTSRLAQLMANAAEAAGEQGKFWEMHDLIYDGQERWSAAGTSKAIDILVGYAKSLELDTADFRAAIMEQRFKDVIARDLADAIALGVSRTPSFFVNGQSVELGGLRAAIELGLQ
jgi:protein-disulfide isomerase